MTTTPTRYAHPVAQETITSWEGPITVTLAHGDDPTAELVFIDLDDRKILLRPDEAAALRDALSRVCDASR